MTKDTGGLAFPQYKANATPGGGIHYDMAGGMTLRDWFAGQALAGTINFPNAPDFEMAARQAYAMADAMIAERNKP